MNKYEIYQEKTKDELINELLELQQKNYDIETAERKLSIDALAASESRYRRLFESAKDGILILDAENGKIVDVNPFLTEILFYSKEQILNKPIWEIGFFKHIVGNEDKFLELQQNEYVRYDDLCLETSHGAMIDVEFVSTVFSANSQKVIQCNIRDITQRKQAELELIKAKEHAEESDRLKTAFLHNLSHEIRTPMNAIVGFSNLMKDHLNDQNKLGQYAEIINLSCNDLLFIIDDIIDIAKIESGQLSLNLEECDISELFTELTLVFTEFQNRMGKQHINFRMHSSCDHAENLIVTDKAKLKQIFSNLLSNAFKFTNEGKIEAGCKFDENHNLLFYVSDTGIGIPPDMQKLIFERFYQLNQNPKKLIGGTGLGLPIVKGLVNWLGGEIFLESALCKGSTFSFTIDYKSVVPFNNAPSIHENPVNGDFLNKTILIVEDNSFNAQYLKEILSDMGFNTIQAETGKEAVEKSIMENIDLVLMDIRLPDTNGYEATRQIHKHKPQLKVLAQTAYVSSEEKQKAIEAGCNDYISKPTKKEVLLSVISKHLYF